MEYFSNFTFMKISIIILFIIFIACNSSEESKKIFDHNKRNGQKANLIGVIKLLETTDCYYSKHIGIDGHENAVYESYQVLQDNATDSLLITLTNSKSAAMRVYALKALLERKSSKTDSIKEKFMHDSAMLCYKSNDCSMSILVYQLYKK